jgi:hypothetical protein
MKSPSRRLRDFPNSGYPDGPPTASGMPLEIEGFVAGQEDLTARP